MIRGSAVNQDGASNGLTAPNGLAQQRVITTALADAGLRPSDIDLVEGHGTGTRLGDPIEARALIEAYGKHRRPGKPLWLGSLKSNMGHAQAASGVGGVIKTVLAMQHGLMPRTLHVTEPTPEVDWNGAGVALLTQARPWTAEPGRPRRAGVSSFGISGTNAHVILEEPPEPTPPPRPGTPLPLVLSAKTPTALQSLARTLHDHLTTTPTPPETADVTHTMAVRDSGFPYRAAFPARDRDALLAGLGELAGGDPADRDDKAPTGRRLFMFAGQGTQRAGMGRQLYDTFPVYAGAFDEACAALDTHLERPLRSVVHAHPATAEALLLDRTEYAQPALFAAELALYRLVRSWGVVPDLVMGHSVGELVAAHVAGVFSLEDAAALVAARGRLMQAAPADGSMVSVRASLAEVEPLLDGREDRAGVAAVNTSTAVVVSGEAGTVAEITAELASRGHKAVPLTVSHAFHSPLMEPVLEPFRDVAEKIAHRPPLLPVLSNVTGGPADPAELATPQYWVEHIRRPVLFAEGVRAARAAEAVHFVEIGPGSTLAALASAVLAEADAGPERPGRPDRPRRNVVALQRGARDEAVALVEGLAAGYARGLAVDWTTVAGAWGTGRTTPLPTYPFEHRRYWLDPGPATPAAGAGGHPFLGAGLEDPESGSVVWSGRLSPRDHPWLTEHVVGGRTLLPGAVLAELVCRAGREAGYGRVDELVLEEALSLADGTDVELRLVLKAPDGADRRPFALHSRPAPPTGDAPRAPAAAWTRNAGGALTKQPATDAPPAGPATWPPDGAQPLPFDPADAYAALAARGLAYGPAFRGLKALWRTEADGALHAEVELPATAGPAAGRFVLHPALLDAALHAVAHHASAQDDKARIPFLWSGVRVHGTGATALRVRILPLGTDRVGLELADDKGAPVMSVASLTLRRPPTTPGLPELWRPAWTPYPLPAAQEPVRVAVLAPPAGASPLLPGAARYADPAALVRALAAGGEAPGVVVVPCTPPAGGAEAIRRTVRRVLALVQQLLAEPSLAGCRTAVVTRGAVGVADGEAPADLAGRAVWGLLRAAQAEEPGRFALLDHDGTPPTLALVAAALGAGAPQLALRDGRAYVPARTAAAPGTGLRPPAGPWRLDHVGRGTPEKVALVPWPEAAAPLRTGEIRVALHAAGVNFRDVLLTLGVIGPRDGVRASAVEQSAEGAGVVTEVGPGVAGLAVGDRVAGLFAAAGPVSVTDHRLVARMPRGWSFPQAAAVPVAYLTAYYGLVELAGLRAGETVLVHTATGAVGMAAAGLARHLGAEVFATASPGKHATLRAMGIPDDHIASSRDAAFAAAFRRATGGRGVDVVLNSLAGELTDASLRVLADGGRFLEMGKTDVRDPAAVAREHRGARYTRFDIRDAGPERIGGMLATLTRLLERGALPPLPVDVRHATRAPEAFRHVAEARHTGKVVLALRDWETDRPVLVTGGLGTLGGLVARHLVRAHGVRQLVLTGRRGADTPGCAELARELEGLGADVTVAACDAGDRKALAELLADLDRRGIAPGAVVHAAGVTHDAAVATMTRAAVDEVLRPKADAAVHLDELTRDAGLSAFVLFSSVAGTTGSAGQANYAAANAVLDGLAERRRAGGLPGLSIAWGLWEPPSALTGRLSALDRQRLARQGIGALSAEEGLALFDEAVRAGAPTVVAARLMEAQATVAPQPGSRSDAARPPLLELVRAETAAVLGHDGPQAVAPDALFPQMGLDSLGAIELRNRISAATSVRLPPTLIFDYPSPRELADHLGRECPGWEKGTEE
ncbi:type I polyketide synthase [Streptomyces sp. NPDC029704]|uniref:type I polyketide synthase n=1 Tax=Streptomyces sp. NPDC029704 TaxID=3156920 RepID=UPI0034080ED2